jgi:hypothetical protein
MQSQYSQRKQFFITDQTPRSICCFNEPPILKVYLASHVIITFAGPVLFGFIVWCRFDESPFRPKKFSKKLQ